MIMNIFRVFKRFLLQVLEEHLNHVRTQSTLLTSKTEGISAILDSIEFVKSQPPLKPFYWNKYLSKVSKLHASECSKNNSVSHKSKKGEKPIQRMKRYGHVFFGGAQSIFTNIRLSKNLQEGTSKSNCSGLVEQVINQIVDDGVPSRWHRKNILSPGHRTIGVAYEEHPSH